MPLDQLFIQNSFFPACLPPQGKRPYPSLQPRPREALMSHSCGNPTLRGHPQDLRDPLCPLQCNQFLSPACRLRTFSGSASATPGCGILRRLCPSCLHIFLGHTSLGDSQSSRPEPLSPPSSPPGLCAHCHFSQGCVLCSV